MMPWILSVTLSLAQVQPSLVAYLNDLILVKAEVVEVEPNPKKRQMAKIKITHVYLGPAKMIGSVFEDEYAPNHSVGSFAEFPFKMGQKGIWSLMDDDGRLFVSMPSEPPYVGRARQGVERDFDEALNVALAIEKLKTKKPAAQIDLAQEWAQGQDAAVAVFAIRTLSTCKTTRTKGFLESLTNKTSLRTAALLTLDDVFCESTGAKWETSKERMELLQRLALRDATSEEGQAILSWLDSERQRNRLAVPSFLSLLTAASNNARLPLMVRKDAVRRAAAISGRSQFKTRITPKEEEAGQAWLAGQVRDQTNQEVRVEAAKCLASIARRDLRARDTIQKLLESVKDERVREALTAKE